MNARIVGFYILAVQFADRFERLAPDADGAIDPTDKKLKAKFLAELERVAKHFETCTTPVLSLGDRKRRTK